MSQNAAWTWFLRNMLLPVGGRLSGQSLMRKLRLLEEAQWWDRARIEEERNARFLKLTKTAFTEVPFYRTLWSDAGISPNDLTCIEDIKKLPIVTKDMLRNSCSCDLVRDTDFPTHEDCSSGSTGAPLCITKDTDTVGWLRANLMLALEWSGWSIGDPHLQTGMTLKRHSGRRLKDLFLRCHYVSAYNLRDEALDEHLSVIDEHNLQYVFGYPGSLYHLANRAQILGWNRPLNSVVTWGDNLFPRYREVIEKTFKTRVFDTYGCNEGIQVSAQCEAGRYHIFELDTLVEFLDDDGRSVAADQKAHLILTRLHPGPTPLIRYRVGDMGIQGQVAQCECKRGFSVMESIDGRDTDILITPSGNRLIVHFFTGIIEFYTEVKTFQVVQHNAGQAILRIVPNKDYVPEVGEEILTKLHNHGAEDMVFQIELVDNIPLSLGGKRRFVINDLDKR